MEEYAYLYNMSVAKRIKQLLHACSGTKLLLRIKKVHILHNYRFNIVLFSVKNDKKQISFKLCKININVFNIICFLKELCKMIF